MQKTKIWVDIGVLGSPYTNESAISRITHVYVRFAPENVPYYITGAKFTVPVNSKLNTYLYIINGWQVIQDNNSWGNPLEHKVEYRPTDHVLFNWNTYIGDERSLAHPEFECDTSMTSIGYTTRVVSSRQLNFYFGYQQRVGLPTAQWW